MNKNKLIFKLKIVIFFLLIIFLITFKTIPKADCEVCKFDWKGEEINIKQLLNIQSQECLQNPVEYPGINYSGLFDE